MKFTLYFSIMHGLLGAHFAHSLTTLDMQQLIVIFAMKIRIQSRPIYVRLNKNNNNLDFRRVYHTSYAQIKIKQQFTKTLH